MNKAPGSFGLLAATTLLALTLGGCGAAKVASETAKRFDRYGCLARDFKNQTPCPPETAPVAPPAP